VESLEALDADLGARIEADWRQRDRAELDAAAEQIRRGLDAL
jgi:hypothetical protein